MKRNELSPISAETFYEGMHIESEIYFKHHNSYILLCKNVILDRQMILRLRQSEQMNQMLYVNQGNLGSILKLSSQYREALEPDPTFPPPAAARAARPILVADTPPDKSPRHLNDLQMKVHLSDKYNHVASQANNMLDVVSRTDQVPLESSGQIAQSINEQLELTDASILLQCINTLRSMDTYLYSHSTNVAMLNGLIGRWLGLSQTENDLLVKTGLLHDIGKLKISKAILNKPARLTQEEYQIIQKHAAYSEELLRNSGLTEESILKGARNHHERMNGSGYPDGLQAGDIPLFARVTAVSDVYDAMIAKRPYKDRQSPFDILEQFATSRFSDLDIEIVNIFLSNITSELLNKTVLLSDGRRAKVAYINPAHFAYPLVRIGAELFQTNEGLKCVAMDSPLSMAD